MSQSRKAVKQAAVGTKRHNMTADLILRLLRDKHADDVFVSECKNGPTHGAAMSRVDAWVMPKSWAHPTIIAYEIKVSRQDFLADDKWQAYLPMCNQFYFVVAPGVASASEIPDAAGLLEVATTGTRLFTRKKAKTRDTDPAALDGVFRYVLMNRVRIVDSSNPHNPDYWKRWLERVVEHKDIGHAVSRKIRRIIDQSISSVEHENRMLRAENNSLAAVKQFADKLGINMSAWNLEREITEKIRPKSDISAEELRRLADQFDQCVQQLTSLANRRSVTNG